jgi:hypothetical protein
MIDTGGVSYFDQTALRWYGTLLPARILPLFSFFFFTSFPPTNSLPICRAFTSVHKDFVNWCAFEAGYTFNKLLCYRQEYDILGR